MSPVRSTLSAAQTCTVFRKATVAMNSVVATMYAVAPSVAQVRAASDLACSACITNAAVVTSVANDFGFDEVFARQIDALGRKDDVAFAITTSGTSANVNRALRRARAAGMRTVALTGRTGGESAGLADVHVNVPGGTSARVQEVQRTILHVMCQLIERTD